MSESWRSTHRHRKGGLYRVICQAQHSETGEMLTIYQSEDGRFWARPQGMFNDGRFEPIHPPPERDDA